MTAHINSRKTNMFHFADNVQGPKCIEHELNDFKKKTSVTNLLLQMSHLASVTNFFL